MKDKPLFSAAVAVTAATILVRLFGFFREVALAGFYGAGSVSDAFIIAFTIPGIVLALVSSSVSSAFIPLYTRVEDNKSFTRNIVSCLTLLGLIFSVVFTIFPQALVFLFASQLDEETFKIAVALTRLMAWAAIPVLLVEILRSYLQLQKVFFIALIVNIPINIMTIAAIAVSKPIGNPVLMSAGTVLGNIICLGLLFFAAKKHGWVYRPYLDLRMPELRKMLILLAPVFISTAIIELQQIIDRNFASSLPSGSVSAMNYSVKVISMISGLIGLSVATVLYPHMSKLSAENGNESLTRYLSGSIKKLTPLLLPITVGFIVLAEPFVRIVFERGSFTAADTRLTSECLRMYALLCLPASIGPVLIRGFYAMRNTKTPALISVFSVVIGVALNFLLIGPLKHQGLALATSIASLVSMFLLIIFLKNKLKLLGLRSWFAELGKTVIATAVMGCALWCAYKLLPVMSGGVVRCIIFTAAVAAASAVLYGLMLRILRSEFIIYGIYQLKVFLKRKSAMNEPDET